jgi:hypothetical protein
MYASIRLERTPYRRYDRWQGRRRANAVPCEILQTEEFYMICLKCRCTEWTLSSFFLELAMTLGDDVAIDHQACQGMG